MFALQSALTEITMKSMSSTNYTNLFQSTGQGSRSPWTVFWILVVIAVIAVVVSWWMNRGQEEEAPAAPAPDEAVPPVEPVAAQAVSEVAAPAVAEAVETAEPAEAQVAADEAESEPPAEEEAEAAPATAEETETEAPQEVAEDVTPDDLTKVEGIGPKISSILQENGIATFAQLAATDVEKLKQIMRDAKLRIAAPDTWPEQAALAAAGKWDELDELQDTFKGGRRVD